MEEEIKNGNLHAAKKNKNDEFYTQRSDIENELKHYKAHFKGKTVFCNCDDPEWSNFWFYFSQNFDHLCLERLISTHYREDGSSYMLEMVSSRLPLERFRKVELKGNGDFRSDECVELLKQSDIVVTNPPFSLFRDYIAQLDEHRKGFIVLGNVNAVTYKEVFKLFAANKIWFGPSISSGDREFRVPSHYPLAAAGFRTDSEGNKFIRVKGVRWFTNLDHKKRHERLELYMRYTENPERYPRYDNFDAIEVSKVKEIPEDYFGAMGVPITFLDKFNPDQFEILWTTDRGGDGQLEHIKKLHTRYDSPVVNGRGLYKRIIIRRKS